MKRLLLISLGFLLGFSLNAAAPPTDRPNIVLIMTDDQGFGDLGITGNPVLDTSNIDALARGGATLTQFYVSPVCSPTRASLMTGRYNYRTRVVDTFKGRSMMDPAEVTVAEVLRGAGYATGIFGKWHLGDNYPLRATDQGFEEALVLRGGGLAQPSEPIENGSRYTDPILFHNNQQVQTKGYCTDVYFEAAMRYMDTAHKGGRPFFTYIACNAPHAPLHDVPEALYAKYKAKDLTPVLLGHTNNADMVARIYAMVENIDQNVGRLMAHLRSEDLLTNTLVIFMSDNGPDGPRYVGQMRGRKTHVHDGGIRSPFFAHWPARFKAGTASDRIAAHIDVMPTLLEAASVMVPKGLKIDGRSLLPLLEGKTATWPDRTLVLQTHRGDVPIPFHNLAIRDQRWKLVHPSGFGMETMPIAVPLELYDVEADPMESKNLAVTHPDEVKRLSAAYDEWFRDVSTTRADNFAPPRIVIGTDHETTTVLTRQDWRVTEPQGWGHNGTWKLHAEQDAIYDVELRWPKPIEPGVIELRVNDDRRALPVKTASASAELQGVRIKQGDVELAVTLKCDGKSEDAYHVILKRVSVGKR
jgi:arylsulfatase A-like enzyme